ncbi:ATP-binding protein [Phytoactinopolyspora halotolerans]|uniref:ATP-binding protein n=1 Tax=Phytoactinopolyspora halotolerans TaxID=1981512 RepID=A0A6L9S6P4_9ACTN|nr:ATP-binding protein [Phytoactinopolyspora halotolerans]NEE00431.1 ATP-binding protein [Phytoactinopolyspora halotolerans]
MDVFRFAARDEFVNRVADLARLEDWWSGSERNVLALYGRRRVGKSWLFRTFADGKPAVVLVADRRAEGQQLNRFADRLAPHLGFRPDLPDLTALFGVLYQLARQQKVLVVIDEFPYLLPSLAARRDEILTAVQAVMEDRDSAELKLILCGSHIGQMTTLLSESSPLRGRLTPLSVEPLRFAEAQAFMPDLNAQERVERYAVAGGMSLYLDELGRSPSDLPERVCERVLDHRGPLFNDPREVLEEELRQPSVYFSLLEELAFGMRSIGDLATALGRRSNELSQYLDTLKDLRLVERIAPVTADRTFRDHRYRVADGFLRFWFRFVFNFQEDLRAGLRPRDHYDGEIAPVLADHVAPVFESLCREWTRSCLGATASRVGAWWGNSLNTYRRSGERQVEEIDIVGLQRSTITIVGECKWTNRAMTPKVLTDLETYKLPAMGQAKLRFPASGPLIVLFSRSFTDGLIEMAGTRPDVRLVALDELVSDLIRAEA